MTPKRLAALLLCALLAACGEPNKLTHGKVIDKKYDSPDTWQTFGCQIYGGDGTCMVFGWDDHYDPAHFKVRIRGVDGQEDLVEWHDVPEEVYVQTRIGENWSE